MSLGGVSSCVVGGSLWASAYGVYCLVFGGGRFRVCCGMVGCTIVGFYRLPLLVCFAGGGFLCPACASGVFWFPFLGVLRCNKLWVCFSGIGISDGLSLCPCRCVMHLGVISCFRVSKINL